MTDDRIAELAVRVGEALKAKGWLLATAESCTGGWVGEAVTSVAGSSAWYDRGFITYSNAAKSTMLGVTLKTLERSGAVSEETAREMASGALGASAAQVAVSITGVAGPGGGSAEKPVGTVCFGWATKAELKSERRRFEGDREAVRRQAVVRALEGLMNLLERAQPQNR